MRLAILLVLLICGCKAPPVPLTPEELNNEGQPCDPHTGCVGRLQCVFRIVQIGPHDFSGLYCEAP